MKILQVGLGNFGKRHLEAWHRLGLGERLWVAESDERKWVETRTFNVPRERLTRNLSDVLADVDIVDVVTPSESHFALCREALAAGKDVFVEKPMTMTLAEAKTLAEMARAGRRLIQVGYYYRFHPISQWLHGELKTGRFGKIRYVTGNFMGFKRARNDVGVTHTDGIHFLDLFAWLLGSAPAQVYAVCRDHFGRKLEDFSIVLLTFADGTVVKVESGYIQPGRWKDKVVPGALTSKEMAIVGERMTAEVDFETEALVLHDVHHELRNGVWSVVVGPANIQVLDPCSPVQMIERELDAFLRCVETRQVPIAGPIESGVHLAQVMECIYESARTNMPVKTGL